jgi:hypothetical protein
LQAQVGRELGAAARSASRAATSAFGQVVDVASGATTTGAEVEQWANNGGGNQKWTFTAG